MKVCILSDNRTGLNWGARATSIALSQLVSEKHEIVGTIYNDLKTKNIHLYHKVLGIFPTRYFTNKTLTRKQDLIEKVLVKLNLLKRVHLCTLDFKKNIENYSKFAAIHPDLKYIERQLSSAELLVVNGEGDMIFTAERKTLIFLLIIMQIAINRGIKVAFINAMVSYPNNITTEEKLSKNDILVKNECLKILAQCYIIQLRENKSADLLSAIAPNLNHKVVPDALFTWYKQVNDVELQDSNAVLGRDMEKSYGAFDFKKPYIVISGSSIFAKRKREDIIKSYVKLVESLKSESYNTYLLAPCSQDNFLNEVGALTNTKVISVHTAVFWGAKVLANAQLYISGRYHPSIMASLGGTPLICFESNSHKMVGLQELIGAQKHVTHFDLPLSDADIVSISQISKEYIFNPEIRSQIKDKVIEINKEVTSLIQEI